MAATGRKAGRTNPCPYCDEGELARDTGTGEITCSVCGAHFENGILVKRRISLGTRYGSGNTQMYHFKKWQQRIRVENAAERNLAFALSELDRISSSNNLPRNVKETAGNFYRKAISRNLVRGRSTECLAATSVYAACRIHNIPRTLEDIADSGNISKKEIGRTYRFLSRKMNLNLLPAKPQDYVRRISVELALNEDIQNQAKDILEQAAEKELLSGLGPTGVAAGAVYIAAIQGNEHRSQRDVARVAGITEVTLRNRYKKLAESLGIEIEFS